MYSLFVIIGTLTATPTIITLQSGLKIATLIVKLKDKGGSLVEVKAYGETADMVLTRPSGSTVIAVGNIRTREWTNKQGKTSHVLELMASKVQVVEDKSTTDLDMPF